MGEWIKCSERLPEDMQRVLSFSTIVNESQKALAYRILDGRILKYSEFDETYWMSLPEPPKEGTQK